MRAKWFCCAFKLGFLQLICKASLIFKSNLELALSVILKQRELYESKHVAVEHLDVFISGINNQNLTLQTYHKSTYTGLLLNFKSFTSFSYKISLIECLIGHLKFVIIGNPFILT